jgi:putative sigma-54 modulation protein
MRLVLTGRHVEISPARRRAVERKLAKLDRLLNDGIVSGQVIFSVEKYRQVVEIVVHARGDHMLRAVAATTGWQTSIADAVEKITQQAQKVKGKWEVRKREARTSKRMPAAAPLRLPGRAELRRRIVRASRYEVKPMSPDEAAGTVGHSPDAFVVFRNTATDSINVLYRRKGGDLGLIEPEA